jgi:hypothetical protein
MFLNGVSFVFRHLSARSRLGLAAGALLVAIGCGGEELPPNRAEVSGTVTFEGKPLPGGSVIFKSETDPNMKIPALIVDGKYSSKRAPIGPCIVTVETESLLLGNPDAYVKIPKHYDNLDESGLTANLEPGSNEVNFDLKSK